MYIIYNLWIILFVLSIYLSRNEFSSEFNWICLYILKIQVRNTWEAQSVESLTLHFSWGHDLMVVRLIPMLNSMLSKEVAWDSLPLFLPLSLPSHPAPVLSLKEKKKKHTSLPVYHQPHSKFHKAKFSWAFSMSQILF